MSLTETAALPTQSEARAHPILWAMRASRGLYKPARHIWWLGDKLLALERGDLTRAVISFPPRHSKSETVSKYFATWWLGKYPDSQVMLCSYGADLTKQWTTSARDLMAEHGGGVFGCAANTRAKGLEWHVYKDGRPRGKMVGVGRGGALSGRGADLLIIDDLIKDPDDVRNPTQRERLWEWLNSTPMTRLQPGARIICIGTRWHHDDYLGRIIAGDLGDGWDVSSLPAVAVEGDALGREPGEPLWPEFWGQGNVEAGREWYARRQEETDPHTWSALYQCAPTPLEGGYFQADWLRRYEGGPPERLRRFATVDLAGSQKERADWTVIATWGLDHEERQLWLLDVVRRRMEAPQIIEAMREVQGRMHPVTFYAEEAGPQLNLVHQLRFAEQAGESYEPGSTAQNVLVQRATDAGLPVVSIKPSRDKITRAGPAAALMKQGRVLVPKRAPWLAAWLDEILKFPGAAHDDQVDTLSYGAQVFLEVMAAQKYTASRTPASGPGALQQALASRLGGI